jgi:hypothetical protein
MHIVSDTVKVRPTEYDRYSQLHKQFDTLAQFEDGQAIITTTNPDPDIRRNLSSAPHVSAGIKFIASGDKYRPSLYTEDGTLVPDAQLGYDGIQYMLIDTDWGVVVGLHGWNYRDNRVTIPTNLRGNASVYYPAMDAPPQGAAISVYRPFKLVPEIAEKMRTLQVLAKARVALEGLSYGVKTPIAYNVLCKLLAEHSVEEVNALLVKNNVCAIASAGVGAITREETRVKYLYTEKPHDRLKKTVQLDTYLPKEN